MDGPWVEESKKLTEVLGLQRKPVAVTFTNDKVVGDRKKVWICRAMKLAAEKGESLVVDSETSVCQGGSWHCGLRPPPEQQARRELQKFLTKGEKLTHSIVSFQRMQDLGSKPPTGMADRILFEPLVSASMRPDLALFVCNGEQACRLISLDHFWDGKPPHTELTGSLCHAAIGYPTVTGNTNVTFGDWTARRMQKYDPDVVFVTIPYERMRNLVAAIEECSAGTASVELPPGISSIMEENE